MTAPTPEASSSDAGWVVIGIGGSIGAANIVLGTSLFVQGGSTSEERLGSATLAAGITGLAISLIVGAILL